MAASAKYGKQERDQNNSKEVRVYDVCSQEIYEFIVVGTFFEFKLHLSGVGASTV